MGVGRGKNDDLNCTHFRVTGRAGAAGRPAGLSRAGGNTTRGGARSIGSSRSEEAAQATINAGRRLTPNEYVYRTIDQAPTGDQWPCLSRNPSCGREDWWAQWNEIQETSPLQFR